VLKDSTVLHKSMGSRLMHSKT